jgi:2-C-methyl-D-erythritol 4-phosphate cytidylyltransferase / 2-C-methyl-D-erythritol 2,4-cyclodiphosphate synthase
MESFDNIAIIVASGEGRRLGGLVAKQYLQLDSKTVLYHSIKNFVTHKLIDAVLVVINEGHEGLFKVIAKDFDLLPHVFGGRERQDSVRTGLEAVRKYNPKKVLIHDAARPFVDKQIINDVIRGLEQSDAVIPVLAVADTVKNVSHGIVTNTIDRSKLRLAQTPQGYNFEKLSELIRNSSRIFTDEAKLFERAGLNVKTVQGKKSNFKITYEEDLHMARLMQRFSKITKVGNGLDIHRFGEVKEGGKMVLGGVLIEHDKGIIAYSDGDIVVHALVDAFLGAIGRGDIGEHFPSDEIKWKNVDSFVFLEKAIDLLEHANAEIVNVDITIICQKPNLSKYKKSIEEKLADFMKIDKKNVNVKATTTDKLGFIGREEGIAVLASVAVSVDSCGS